MGRRLLSWYSMPLLLGAFLVSASAFFQAQETGHGFTTADIERGGQIYLLTCASCHGPNGDTVPGVNIATGSFRRATTDQDLAALVRRGIPGTAMPPNSLSEAEALQVVAYLRAWPAAARASTSTPGGLPGRAVEGRALYGTLDCATCHMLDGRGGYLGPDLSSAGITRTPDELRRALTDPSADIRVGMRTVTVQPASGPPIMGRLLNHDTYTLQFIDTAGRLTSVRKDAVRTWAVMEASAMPNYATSLTAQQIADLVAYMQTLNAPVRTGGVAGTPRGGGRGGAPAAPPAGRGRGGPP
jgi:cytochrome c oxidase cbb3-type subunit 3